MCLHIAQSPANVAYKQAPKHTKQGISPMAPGSLFIMISSEPVNVHLSSFTITQIPSLDPHMLYLQITSAVYV